MHDVYDTVSARSSWSPSALEGLWAYQQIALLYSAQPIVCSRSCIYIPMYTLSPSLSPSRCVNIYTYIYIYMYIYIYNIQATSYIYIYIYIYKYINDILWCKGVLSFSPLSLFLSLPLSLSLSFKSSLSLSLS